MGNKQMKQDSEECKKPKNKKSNKKRKKRHLFLKTVIVLFAIIIILAGVLAGYVFSKYSLMEYDKMDKNEIERNADVEEAHGYRNIALFGVDSRKNNYENTLSDSIMVVSINQDTKKVKIASIYRDTYLKVGNGYDKITHAFSKGGAKLSLSSLNTNLDLTLTDYVAVNFNVVVDVVDEVGGVELEITSAEVKWINQYIDEVNKVTGHKSKHIEKAGTYNLDGVQAVAYSRIRYTAGGDWERTNRQRKVLGKAFEKVKSMNIAQLNKLADIVLKEISTNIEPTQIFALLSQVGSYEIEDTVGWPETKGWQPGDVWYGVPANLETQVKELHKFLFNEEEYEPSSAVKTISNYIINKTGIK